MIVSAISQTQKAINAILFDFTWISILLVIITRFFYDRYGYLKPRWSKRNKPAWLIVLIVLFFPVFVLVQLVRGIYILISIIVSSSRYKNEEHNESSSYNSKYRKKKRYGFYETPRRIDSDFIFEEEKSKITKSHTYTTKSLMTDCEKEYYKIIASILKEDYSLQPQIPLSSIVNKENNHGTPLELYRTIDFAILNSQKEIICLIEINDRSHHRLDRIERDQKVRSILNDAGIPLATIWTDKGMDPEYIKDVIKTAIQGNA